MARAFPASTWERGFKSPLGTDARPWKTPGSEEADEDDTDAYVCPPSKTLVTSTVHNDVGVSVIRTWPTLYDGTNSPHGVPSWWKHPGGQVDVLICGGKIREGKLVVQESQADWRDRICGYSRSKRS